MLSQERPLAVNLPHLSPDKFYQGGKGSTAREEGLGTRLGWPTMVATVIQQVSTDKAPIQYCLWMFSEFKYPGLTGATRLILAKHTPFLVLFIHICFRTSK